MRKFSLADYDCPQGLARHAFACQSECGKTIRDHLRRQRAADNQQARGLVCHPTKTDECSSLISRARLHLGPDSRPHLVNRLDRETSGVTIAAKDLETARELRRIWENRQVEKDYLAIMHGLPRLAACGIVLSA